MVSAPGAGTAADALAELGVQKAEKAGRRKDTEREMERAIIQDADKTDGADRDLVHGDGSTLDLAKPEDLGHDD
jgi:hypothetical protein